MKNKITLLVFILLNSAIAFGQATATMTVSPGTIVCDNQPVTFTVAIVGCSSTYTIDWIKNGFTQSTCSEPCSTWTTTLLSGTQAMWCTVHCVTQGNPSSNLITMTVNPCSGIEELENASLTTVYPNPATENITIDILKVGSAKYELFVFEQSGNRMKVSYEVKDNSAVFSTTQLAQGLYYYKLTDEKGRKYAAGKFVVAK